MRTKTDEFLCVDDAGNEYKIIEFTEQHSIGFDPTQPSGESLVPGLKEYFTDSGIPCNRLSDDRFMVFVSSLEEISVRAKNGQATIL